MNYKGLINTLQDRPLCQAQNDTDLDITTGGGWKEIPLNQANIDNGLMYDSINDRIKIIKAGSYLINGNTGWAAGDDNGDRRMLVTKNGGLVFSRINDTPRGNSNDQMAVVDIPVVDDYYQLWMFQNSGSTIKTLRNICKLDIYKLAEL